MKVLLYEQWHGGHYANYMECLVPALAPLCDRLVIAVGQRMRESADAVDNWARLPNVEFADTLPEVRPQLGIRDRYAATRNLLRCLKSVRPDYTIIPSADAQSTWIALMNVLGYNVVERFGPMEGTIHYGYGFAATSFRNKLKEAIYSNTYRHLPYSSVNFVNFDYHDFAVAKRLIDDNRMRFVGDPVPQPNKIGRVAARTVLGLRQDGRYLGILGSLDNRKAIPEILAAFRVARLRNDDRLVLAGRMDAPYMSLVDTQYRDLVDTGRLVVMNRFLTADELEHGYEALDVATIAYAKSPVLASLALKAIHAGAPLIADDFGWLGTVVKRFDLGCATDVYDAEAFGRAMTSALASPHAPSRPEAVRRLLAFHTVQNFVAQMTQGLRRLADQADRPILEWQWVLDALPAAASCSNPVASNEKI